MIWGEQEGFIEGKMKGGPWVGMIERDSNLCQAMI